MDLEIKNKQVEFITKTEGFENAVFRVFEHGEKNMLFYASSRLSTVSIFPDKLNIRVPEELAGNDYEIKVLPELKVISKGRLISETQLNEEDDSDG